MKIILLLLLLTIPFIAKAQFKHELKSDIRSFYGHNSYASQVGLFYEFLVKSTVGYEVDVNYYWVDKYLADSLVNFPNYYTTYQDYDTEYIRFGIAYKFYPSKKKNTTGFYLGLYNVYEIETYREKGYKEHYKELYKRAPKIYTLEALALGGSIGYKLLVKKRFIIESNLRMGLDIVSSFRFSYFNVDLDGDFFIKVGYRFGKSKSQLHD